MNIAYPEPISRFLEGLELLFPDAEATVERGGKTSGVWWLDIAAPQTHVVVHWEAASGFSLEEIGDDSDGFGTLPAERYKTSRLALKRMTQLLAKKPTRAAVGGLALREVRELCELSQSELGKKLGIKQAAVSRAERRSDLHLDTLATVVEALGGTLEIRARFPEWEVPMKFGQSD